MSPSYNHSYAKAKLIGALLKLEKFSVFSELTLKIDGKNYTPDVCLYSKRDVNLSLPDTIEITDMPVLAIEILSHTQTLQGILDNIVAYFGTTTIKSCWLVVPVVGAVVVYVSPEKAHQFRTGDIVDEQLNIRVPLQDIFD
jgi:Uma2 family endonuclease